MILGATLPEDRSPIKAGSRHPDDDVEGAGSGAEETVSKDGKPARPLTACEIAYRLRVVLALAWLMSLQSVSISPTSAYASLSFFAGPGNDCDATPDSDACKRGAADLAYWTGWSRGASHGVAWLSALVLGSWSDSIGRRPLFRTKALLSVVPVAALAAHVYTHVSLYVYLIAMPIFEAYDINGVFLAFMSDVITAPHDRAHAFGVLIIGVVVGIGLVFPLARWLPAEAACAVALGAAMVKLVFMYTLFPETAPKLVSRQGESKKPHFTCLGMARQSVSVFGRHSFIQRMVMVLVVSGISLAGLATLTPPILTGYLGMHKDAGVTLMAICLASMLIAMVGLLKPLVRILGEVNALRVCLAASVAYPILFAFCQTVWQVEVLSFVLIGPMVLQFPIISAIKSNLVAEDEQGLVQGALAAIRVVAVAAADIFFGWLYRNQTQEGQAPRSSTLVLLFLVAGLAVVALGVACTLPRTPPPPPPKGHCHGVPPLGEPIELSAAIGS